MPAPASPNCKRRRSTCGSLALALGLLAGNVVSAAEPAPRIGAWRTVVIPAAGGPIATASLPPPEAPLKPVLGPAHQFDGLASFYWQGQMTASGEHFDRRQLTAAHKTLPFGTRVRVTHTASGRAVIVRINDRGPFKPGRVIDLSEAAAEQIGMTSAGLAPVRLEVVR